MAKISFEILVPDCGSYRGITEGADYLPKSILITYPLQIKIPSL
jgi:hypothetical protein